MRFTIFCIALIFMFSQKIEAQIGGENIYRFLSLTNSAKVASLGGQLVTMIDSTDLNLPFHNPALLNKNMVDQVLINYINHFEDINYGYASYAMHFDRIGAFAAGVHYVNYGNFVEATEEGERTGAYFKAAEYALNLMYANQFRQFRYGVNMKPVFSVFEKYQSAGLVFDAGVSWSAQNRRTHVGVAARNFGFQLSKYYKTGERESMPFDIQAGVSHKVKYAPIVLSLTAHNLNNWVLAKPDNEELEGDEEFFEPSEKLPKQIMRHLIWGVEVLPSQNFIIRAGYNYHRRQELKVEERVSTVGFSVGFGVKIKRFRLDYGLAHYHLAGASNHFSLSFNINNLWR